MYNHVRTYLIVSARIYRKVLTQSSHESILLPEIDCYANARHLWNNTMCKRFYYQIAINERNNQTNINAQSKQKLDEFLSNSENEKLFQILKLELEAMRHNVEKVPKNISPRHWLELLKLSTKSQRKKHLGFLWRIENLKESKRVKKKLKQDEWLTGNVKATIERAKDTGEIIYGFCYNTLFLNINKQRMNNYYNSRLIQAMMFEPKIVFDCDYENHMSYFEIHNCAKQLTMAFARNRSHINPMCLYFCNFNKDGLLMQHFHCNMPNLLDNDFPAIITSQSYLNLFPRDQLLYLTPHCETDLTEYDPDMVYIIGAMVDKNNPKPLSLAKAKKEGIRMAKLPIEKYLDWGPSSTKSFALNQIMGILLDIRYTGDWKKALQHVPNRKLKQTRERMFKKKLERLLCSKSLEIQKSSMISYSPVEKRIDV